MSVNSISTVLEKSQAQGAARFVLTVIAHPINAGGYAWPSVETLCRETGYGERYIHRLLKDLKTSGELIIEQGEGPHGTNRYRLGGLLGGVVYSSGEDSVRVVQGSENCTAGVVYRPPERKTEGTNVSPESPMDPIGSTDPQDLKRLGLTPGSKAWCLIVSADWIADGWQDGREDMGRKGLGE